jgi:hypothetical protein
MRNHACRAWMMSRTEERLKSYLAFYVEYISRRPSAIHSKYAALELVAELGTHDWGRGPSYLSRTIVRFKL